MANLRNARKHCVTEGEKKIWDFLNKHLSNDFWVWTNVKLMIENRGALESNEIDLILYHKAIGILVFSIKDWRIDQIKNITNNRIVLSNNDIKANPFLNAEQHRYCVQTKLKKNEFLDERGRLYRSPYIIRYAIKALGDIKDTRAIASLSALLDDVDPNVREEVINALVKIGKPAVEPLIVALNEEHSYVRWGAAKALGQIKDPRAIEPLFAVLQTIPLCPVGYEIDVRWCLIWALAELKDNRLVEPLIELLKSKETVARWKAASYLYSITGQKFGDDAPNWQEWWEENKEEVGKGIGNI
jgi:hypothetical protein